MTHMTQTNHYRTQLRALEDWDAFLKAESGLPGPRANLALADAAAAEGDPAHFARWLRNTADVAPAPGCPLARWDAVFRARCEMYLGPLAGTGECEVSHQSAQELVLERRAGVG